MKGTYGHVAGYVDSNIQLFVDAYLRGTGEETRGFSLEAKSEAEVWAYRLARLGRLTGDSRFTAAAEKLDRWIQSRGRYKRLGVAVQFPKLG